MVVRRIMLVAQTLYPSNYIISTHNISLKRGKVGIGGYTKTPTQK